MPLPASTSTPLDGAHGQSGGTLLATWIASDGGRHEGHGSQCSVARRWLAVRACVSAASAAGWRVSVARIAASGGRPPVSVSYVRRVEPDVAVGEAVVEVAVVVRSMVVVRAEEDAVGEVGLAALEPRDQVVGLAPRGGDVTSLGAAVLVTDVHRPPLCHLVEPPPRPRSRASDFPPRTAGMTWQVQTNRRASEAMTRPRCWWSRSPDRSSSCRSPS